MDEILTDLEDLSVVVGAGSPAEGGAICQGLLACGVRAFSVCQSLDDFMELCATVQPDMAIVTFALGKIPALGVMQAVHGGEKGVNKFLPIIVAKTNANARAVQAAIHGGAHEFLALPSSKPAFARILHRAVFIGRPFIETESYVGPCRRRRQVDNYGVEDRRKAPWPGYTHAAHEEVVLD